MKHYNAFALYVQVKGGYMYKKIEKLMKERGITAYRLSKDTGIAYSSLSDWKRGKSNPKLDKLVILSKYFDVSIEYFLNLEKR